MNTGATTSVKSIVAAFEIARMRREMERRRQRMDELYAITSVASATPSPASLASLSSSASSTTPSAPTPSAPTSIDTTMVSSITTSEPVQTAPARCSTAGLIHDECALAAVTAVPDPSSTSPPVFTTMPVRCSVHYLSHNVDTLQPLNSNKGCSVECSQVRYINNSTLALSGGTVRFCLDTKVVCKVFGEISSQKTLLEPAHAQVLGKGPWPPPQICFNYWPMSSCGCVTRQQRPPWPPPIQPGMHNAVVQRRPPPWPIITNDTVDICNSVSVGSKCAMLCSVDTSKGVFENYQYVVATKIICISSYCSKPGMYYQQQAVTAMNYWCGDSVHVESFQLFTQGNSSALECWNSCLVAVLIKLRTLKRVNQNMQQSVTKILFLWYFITDRSLLLLSVNRQWNLIILLRQKVGLLSQSGDMVVLSEESVLMWFKCCQQGVVLKTFLLLILHYPFDYYDHELATARSSNFLGLLVLNILLWCLLPVIRNGLPINVQNSWPLFLHKYLHHLSLYKLPLVPSIRVMTDCGVLFIDLLTVNSAQDHWLQSFCTRMGSKVLLTYLPGQAHRVIRLQILLHTLFECSCLHDGDENDGVNQLIYVNLMSKFLFSYCYSLSQTEKLFKPSSLILNIDSRVSDMMLATIFPRGQCPDCDWHFISMSRLHFKPNVAHIQWLQHVMIFGITMTKQIEISSLDAPKLIDGWFCTPKCSSLILQMRYVLLKLVGVKYISTMVRNHIIAQPKRGNIDHTRLLGGHSKLLAVPVLQWSHCWILIDSNINLGQPAIRSKISLAAAGNSGRINGLPHWQTLQMGLISHNTSSFSPYRVLLLKSKQWCSGLFWKPPWPPPIHQSHSCRFTKPTTNQQGHSYAVTMICWHTYAMVQHYIFTIGVGWLDWDGTGTNQILSLLYLWCNILLAMHHEQCWNLPHSYAILMMRIHNMISNLAALLPEYQVHLSSIKDDIPTSKLLMEHRTASLADSLIGGILFSAQPFYEIIQLPAIHPYTFPTSTCARLPGTTGILISILLFYCSVIDDP